MKTGMALPLFLIIAVLFGFLFVGVTEIRDYSRTQQKEIDYLKKVNKDQADSMAIQLKLTADSLQIAKNTIIYQFYKIESDSLEKANYKRNTHDKIHFIGFTHDASRDSMLTKLYPSFRPLR